MYTTRRTFTPILAALVVATSHAQYATDFEPPAFTGSIPGTAMSGQDGFFVPAGSHVDGRCYRYDDNDLGIVPNPNGGQQFVAVKKASADFARTQHPVSFDAADCWFVHFDVNVSFLGELPTANYAGSVSLQPFPDDGSVVVLFYWDDSESAESFNVRILGFDAGGATPYLAGLPIPNGNFQNLDANRWYHLTLRVEFLAANAVTGLSIVPLDGGEVISDVPTDLHGWHLGGGSNPVDRPNGFRLFGGGGSAGDHYTGNIVAVDNLNIVPTTDVPCFSDLDLNGVIDLQDLAFLLAHFGQVGNATYLDGDLDCDRDVDLDDLALLLSQFGALCL